MTKNRLLKIAPLSRTSTCITTVRCGGRVRASARFHASNQCTERYMMLSARCRSGPVGSTVARRLTHIKVGKARVMLSPP